MSEQINDGAGNMFTPNCLQERLYRAGWRVVSRRKQGCLWLIRWRLRYSDAFSQGTAWEIEMQRTKQRKADARMMALDVLLHGRVPSPSNPSMLSKGEGKKP